MVVAVSEQDFEALPASLRERIKRTETCWIWTAACNNAGYGAVWFEGRHWHVHRLVYTLLAGPIPDGLTIDHVKDRGCTSKPCCWPPHLEPVTSQVNTLRGDTITARNAAKTRCPQGHAYDEANTYRQPNGGRGCRACRRRAWRESHARRVARGTRTPGNRRTEGAS